jgi:hypothetical protein
MNNHKDNLQDVKDEYNEKMKEKADTAVKRTKSADLACSRKPEQPGTYI